MSRCLKVAARGGLVYINRVDDSVSRLRGAAEPRRRTSAGAVCHRGGVDGRPDKDSALVPVLKRKMGDRTSVV